jgi:hypothetical protein
MRHAGHATRGGGRGAGPPGTSRRAPPRPSRPSARGAPLPPSPPAPPRMRSVSTLAPVASSRSVAHAEAFEDVGDGVGGRGILDLPAPDERPRRLAVVDHLHARLAGEAIEDLRQEPRPREAHPAARGRPRPRRMPAPRRPAGRRTPPVHAPLECTAGPGRASSRDFGLLGRRAYRTRG